MILVADSGSTKCDWKLVKDNGETVECSTMGFNPYFHDEAIVMATMNMQKDLEPYFNDVKNIFFYGAGCSADHLNVIIKRGLEAVFPNAEVVVDHDLKGAAWALYRGVPEIACIIGTGSNSCFFDGETLYEESPALAYILGDEGSGSYFGKRLLTHYLYNKLPDYLHDVLKNQYHLDKHIIFENVYMKPHANVYLASFMRVLSPFKDKPWVHDMIFKGMTKFLERHVCTYDNYKEVETNFVGSGAFYFQDILAEAAEPLGVKIGHIVQKPIDNIVAHHLKAAAV